MKFYKVGGVVVAQLICLITFSVNFDFGLYFMITILSLSVLIPIILLLLKNTSAQTKFESKHFLIGTICTIILIVSSVYWLAHSFSR